MTYCYDLPDIPVTDSYQNQDLWRLVQLLEKEFRSVIVLFYYEDMSIKGISDVLALPQGTVKSRLSRAKAKLKQLLEKEGGPDYEGL